MRVVSQSDGILWAVGASKLHEGWIVINHAFVTVLVNTGKHSCRFCWHSQMFSVLNQNDREQF